MCHDFKILSGISFLLKSYTIFLSFFLSLGQEIFYIFNGCSQNTFVL